MAFAEKFNKWAMMAHKGGRCYICGVISTFGSMEKFQFDHKVPLGNGGNKTDRWGGDVRRWKPFTDAWRQWAETVDLVCETCHRNRHRPVKKQLSWTEFWEVQERMDHADPTPPTIQVDLEQLINAEVP